MAEVVLHIGTKKTGTTYLQSFLSANRQGLAVAGWTYPAFLGRRNHHGLAIPFTADKTSETHQLSNVGNRQAAERAISDLDEQLTKHVKPDQRWVFSSEFLSSRLLTDTEIRNMLALLRGHFSTVRAVVYFRRQDFMVPSTYSQAVKEGSSADLDWRFVESRMADFNNLAVFRSWRRQLGDENLTALPYFEDYKVQPQRLLASFLTACGIPDSDDYEPPSQSAQNPQLRSEGIAVLRAINARFPASPPASRSARQQRIAIARRIAKTTNGPVIGLTPELLRAIMANFADRNAELVADMGDPTQWATWLAQPPAPVAERADQVVTNARLAEVLLGLPGGKGKVSAVFVAQLISLLSRPAGIVDWSDPQGYPVMGGYRRVARNSRRLFTAHAARASHRLSRSGKG